MHLFKQLDVASGAGLTHTGKTITAQLGLMLDRSLAGSKREDPTGGPERSHAARSSQT